MRQSLRVGHRLELEPAMRRAQDKTPLQHAERSAVGMKNPALRVDDHHAMGEFVNQQTQQIEAGVEGVADDVAGSHWQPGLGRAGF